MLKEDTIIRPVYYQIVERRQKIWAFREGEPFVNLFNAPDLDLNYRDQSLRDMDTDSEGS